MALSFGLLVFLSVGGVLMLTVGANYRNTVDLLGARSTLLLDAMEDSVRSYLGRAEDAVDGVAKLYAEGAFDIDDGSRMASALSGALAGVPGASGMLIYTVDSRLRGPVRDDGDPTGPFEFLTPRLETAPQVLTAMEARRRIEGRQWGNFVATEYGLFANVSAPLTRDGVVAGWIIAPVGMSNLSAITRDLSARFETHAFILDGTSAIIADERLADMKSWTKTMRPLVPLSSFGDPVLARFSTRSTLEQFDRAAGNGVQISEIEDVAGASGEEDAYITLTKSITGYGQRPWTIGAYYGRRDIADEVMRAWLSGAVGLGALVLAVVAAVMLGKRLARPVQAIAGQAQRLAEFDLDGATPLPRSRVRELDEQAVAFNAMLTGLRAFSTYVPRSLVARLVRSGEIDAARPREALVTVMFTDIAGFTSLSEQMEAGDTAGLLNHHFQMLCEAVDAHGGTVDKFLGDGMMAFFGAPDQLKGHAAAAVRAAAAIRTAIEDDNRRAGEDRPKLRLRIGIHTGRVIVGNIGAADRVNYTIIGDTVNVSQRLQDIGKLVAPDSEVSIVVSGETEARLDETVRRTSAGKHRLRGRGEPIEVFVVGDVSDMRARVRTAGAA